MKECTKCNEVKELTEFYKDKRNNDNHGSWCRSCVRDHGKTYYTNNKKRSNEAAVKWQKANPDKVRRYKRRNHRRRYNSDPSFRFASVTRKRIRNALKGTSKSASTIELLGCTAEHARFHIESQFTEGMTWDNIHIDHIQPCASFDLEDPSEQRKCFHYSNLQPLFASDNLRKSDKIVPEHQVRLL
jgi:hypothetical protein